MPSLPPSMPQFESSNDATSFQPTTHHDLGEIATRAQAQASQSQNTPRSRTRQAQQPQPHSQVIMDHTSMQIDPSLLLAAANDPSLMNQRMQSHYSEQQYADQQYTAQAAQATFPPSPSAIAIYFRLHPASDVQTNNRLWVSTLTSVSVDELRQLATVKFPGTI